ncbi:hypothetical protein GGX14DRAFT_401863 [Mycena pura]|uniref:Uncharacterized protein n=1 Tax=Mycena pura TaxID=153505 RepID=A0AAD6Y7W2_9AGAR|nr:hypothetical protein GGX14DRAFT_401863 [Mycena pura]
MARAQPSIPVTNKEKGILLRGRLLCNIYGEYTRTSASINFQIWTSTHTREYILVALSGWSIQLGNKWGASWYQPVYTAGTTSWRPDRHQMNPSGNIQLELLLAERDCGTMTYPDSVLLVLVEAESEALYVREIHPCAAIGFAFTIKHKILLFITGFAVLKSLSKIWSHLCLFPSDLLHHLYIILMSNAKTVRIHAGACQKLVEQRVNGEITNNDFLERLQETEHGSREATPDGLTNEQAAQYRADCAALLAQNAEQDRDGHQARKVAEQAAADVHWGVLHAKINTFLPQQSASADSHFPLLTWNDEPKEFAGGFALIRKEYSSAKTEADWTRVFAVWRTGVCFLYLHQEVKLSGYLKVVTDLFHTVAHDPSVAICFDAEARDKYAKSPSHMDNCNDHNLMLLAQMFWAVPRPGSALLQEVRELVRQSVQALYARIETLVSVMSHASTAVCMVPVVNAGIPTEPKTTTNDLPRSNLSAESGTAETTQRALWAAQGPRPITSSSSAKRTAWEVFPEDEDTYMPKFCCGYLWSSSPQNNISPALYTETAPPLPLPQDPGLSPKRSLSNFRKNFILSELFVRIRTKKLSECHS